VSLVHGRIAYRGDSDEDGSCTEGWLRSR